MGRSPHASPPHVSVASSHDHHRTNRPGQQTDVDAAAVEEFASKLIETITGGLITSLIEIGRRTGLFELAAAGPATSAELAERGGLQERYVREWLAAMATAGIVEYDADNATLLAAG